MGINWADCYTMPPAMLTSYWCYVTNTTCDCCGRSIWGDPLWSRGFYNITDETWESIEDWEFYPGDEAYCPNCPGTNPFGPYDA